MIIAFEGIDACGKATQVRMLAECCEGLGIPCRVYSYPAYETETGKRIQEMLRLADGERDGLLLQSLMTVNRYESQCLVEESHVEGELVILDRYWLSGLVYGQMDGLDSDWLVRVHERLLQPSKWLVLDISVAESFKRRPVREDCYEDNVERLEKARTMYKVFAEEDPSAFLIDGMQDEELVLDEIMQAVEL